MNEIQLSAIILTKNEETNIKRCIQSLSFADEVIVIDDFSTDRTEEIATQLGARVVKHALNNDFTQQRNFAMQEAKGEWILFVDADEEVSPKLKNELIQGRHVFSKRAYFIPRIDFWWGRELKYGEVRQARKKGFIRLLRKNSGKWMGKVHEQYVITSQVGRLSNPLLHYPHQTLRNFIAEVNHYSTIRAKELFQAQKKTNILQILMNPSGKFIWNYIFNLGFLDGVQGFAYAFLMSFHSFLVRAKLYQYQTGLIVEKQ